MKECKHNFQPRYNREWSTDILDVVTAKQGRWTGLDGLSYLRKETYVYDICVKCGETRWLQ